MQTLQEFKESIAPKLEQLEKIRAEKYKAYLNTKTLYIIPISIVLVMVYTGAFILFIFLLIPLFASMIISSLVNQHVQKYLLYFKVNILKNLIKAFQQDAQYITKQNISRLVFKDSGLLEPYSYTYTGEDYFTGTSANGYGYELSKLHIASGDKIDQADIFRGLFYVFHTPDLYYPTIKIFPKQLSDKKRLGSLITGLNEVPTVPIDPTFRNSFIVYSDDGNALNVLSPALLKAILQIQEKWDQDIKLAFAKNKIYLSIETIKDFFTANIKEPIHNDGIINRIYSDMVACFHPIEIMSKTTDHMDKVALNNLLIQKQKEDLEQLKDNDLSGHLIDWEK